MNSKYLRKSITLKIAKKIKNYNPTTTKKSSACLLKSIVILKVNIMEDLNKIRRKI